MNKPSIRWKVFGLIVTAIMALLCTAGIHVDAERHAMTLASMDVPQLLSYALVISVLGNVVLVLLFARVILVALQDNTRALQDFTTALKNGHCPMGSRAP
jgi:hypothetical protein